MNNNNDKRDEKRRNVNPFMNKLKLKKNNDYYYSMTKKVNKV